MHHPLKHLFIVSLESVPALILSESASVPLPRPSSASSTPSGDDYTNITSASTKTDKGLSRFTTMDDTIEMLHDMTMDALASFRGLFRFHAA